MKKWMIAILMTALAGCQSTMSESKANAYHRWNRTRAEMLCRVAQEQFKVGQLDRAADKAQEALSLDPQCAEARLLLGKTYIEQGHDAAAVAQLARVNQQIPNSPKVTYLLAVAQEKAGNLKEALRNYQKTYALDSRNIAAVTAAGEVMVEMGRCDEARSYIRGHLAEARTNPGIFELAGRLAMMAKDYAEAASDYQNAHDLDSTNVQYLESLVRAQFFANQTQDALDTIKVLLASKGYSPKAWVYCMQGDCLLDEGRPFDARDAFSNASQVKPDDPGVWTDLAKAAVACQDNDRAVLAAEKALELEPGRFDATLVLGYALVQKNQGARAVQMLSRAAASHPDSATVQCLLGRAYAATGDAAQATRCYLAALRVAPGNPLAKHLLAAAGTGKLSKSQ